VKLRLSSDFAVDTDDYKREGLRFSILAMSGHGKSNAAADLIEDVLDNHTQVEYVVSDNEVGLPSDSVEPFSLVDAKLHRNNFSALQCCYGHSINSLPRENASSQSLV